MIKIKDQEEAKLMNTILQEMIDHKVVFNQIPHNLGITYDYFQSILARIVDYNDSVKQILRYSKSEDYYSFTKLFEYDEFVNSGGFEKVFVDYNNDLNYNSLLETLKAKNLVLENEALEYQRKLRDQDQRIRDMQETDLKLSIWQKYWWIFTIVAGLLGFLIDEIL